MRASLTAGELRELIKDVPDRALVLVPFDDHRFRTCSANIGTVLKDDEGEYHEDHGEDVTPEAEYGKRVRAVIIS